MSYDDEDHRPTRGAYTPPTDDDLPLNRRGYETRRAGGSPPPWTLIISGGVLLVLILVVLGFYAFGGMRASEDAPLVGEPVGDIKVEPVDAQPLDPAEGVSLYEDAPVGDGSPEFAPPPETVQPRPIEPAAEPAPATPPTKTTPAPPAKTEPAAPAPTAPASQGGSAAVQIGAFSSTERADRAYAEVAAAFPSFMSGRGKRVTETTNAGGTTLYRTIVTGFSAADARAFCDALKAADRACSVQ